MSMIAALLATAQALSPSVLVEVEGRCAYSEEVRQRAIGNTTLWFCNKVTVLHDSRTASFRFDGPAEQTLTFFGTLTGSEMVVEAIRVDTGRLLRAEGSCRIDRTNGSISVVACLAGGNGRFHATNLVADAF